MEVSVNLPEPLNAALQFLPPLDAGALDRDELRSPGRQGLRRIAVYQSHDALGMADKLADPAHIEARIFSLYRMNFAEIVTKRVCASNILGTKVFCIANSLEIRGVGRAVSVIRESEELFRVSQGDHRLVGTKCSDIDGAYVPRQSVKGGVIP